MIKKLASILLVLIIPANLLAKEIVFDLRKKTPVSSSVRSALVPGWGQVNNGNEKKGKWLFTGFVFFAGASSFYFSKARENYDEYQKLGIAESNSYNDYISNYDRAAMLGYAAAACWLYSVLDAYMKAGAIKRKPFKKGLPPVMQPPKKKKVSIMIDNSIKIVYGLRF